MTATDSEIINGCLAGKSEAFQLLYDKYAATMLGVCSRYARNNSDAEDLLQIWFYENFRKSASI